MAKFYFAIGNFFIFKREICQPSANVVFAGGIWSSSRSAAAASLTPAEKKRPRCRVPAAAARDTYSDID